MIKICPTCKKEYKTEYKKQISCSMKCRTGSGNTISTNEILYQDEFYVIIDISTKRNKNKTSVFDTKFLSKGILDNGRWGAIFDGWNYYVSRNSKNNKFAYMHNFILNYSGKKHIDHKNCDSTDNRELNLRKQNQSKNKMNRGKSCNNTSGYKGVEWIQKLKKWRSRIRINRKSISLGCYENIHDAAIAYNEGSKKYHGKYGRLNIINV